LMNVGSFVAFSIAFVSMLTTSDGTFGGPQIERVRFASRLNIYNKLLSLLNAYMNKMTVSQ
jgi:hypothetical protein